MSSLSESLPPDITETLPYVLTRGYETVKQSFAADDRFDIAINGLGFLLKATDQSPYQRAPEQVRKQQLDTSREAGEQSLGSWWMRSQASWHLGAGIRWYEPGAEETTQYRFATSQGVDVWTEGELKLLRTTVSAQQGLNASTTLATLRRGGVDGFVVASGSALSWRNASGPVVSATLPSAASTQPAVTGGLVWVGHGGGVSRWDTAGGGSLTTPLTGSAARVWWVKSRLVVSQGASLYEVAPTLSGVISSVGTLIVAHPDPTWVWTDVAETADAILATGYAGSESTVYAVSLVDATPLPTLGGPRQVAKLPPGEQVMCMGAYLGAYVVLGTTSGVRVGVIGQDGAVEYGPVTVPTSTPVLDLTFADRFAYVAVTGGLPDGSSGAARIDLSAPIGDTRTYAWNWDVSTQSTTTASSLCLLGNTDRVVVVAGGGLMVQAESELVPVGWLESGQIRYATTELKNFQYAKLAGELRNGTVEVTAVTAAGVEHRVVTYDSTTGIDGEASISVPNQPRLTSLGFRLWLTPNGATSPLVTGFSAKALPAVRRARLVAYPLSCEDHEVTRHGAKVGYDGAALHRVLEMEELESMAVPVQVRDRRTGEAFVALIESVEFTGVQNPDRSHGNVGGVLTVTVRAL